LKTKALQAVHRTTESHWVGDGFPVRTLFSYQGFGAQLSPFLLLDYAGPAEFAPTTKQRGVGAHPHRGFETVTVVYRGEVEHRDSTGNQGRIGPGDVQWMTAASGILHEEMHAKEFSSRGGPFEVVQLWVNLPQRFKMTEPRYQTLLDKEIPVVELPGDAGSARLIAGSLHGKQGPAQTFTPINLWDLKLRAGRSVTFALNEGDTAVAFVLDGRVAAEGDARTATAAELMAFERAGNELVLRAEADARVLLMTGEPIDEPVVGYGPFVMNTRQEIEQAISDIRAGTFIR
jgi:redox-sensitive bicupin YhaK (pirin superfamily)